MPVLNTRLQFFKAAEEAAASKLTEEQTAHEIRQQVTSRLNKVIVQSIGSQ